MYLLLQQQPLIKASLREKTGVSLKRSDQIDPRCSWRHAFVEDGVLSVLPVCAVGRPPDADATPPSSGSPALASRPTWGGGSAGIPWLGRVSCVNCVLYFVRKVDGSGTFGTSDGFNSTPHIGHSDPAPFPASPGVFLASSNNWLYFAGKRQWGQLDQSEVTMCIPVTIQKGAIFLQFPQSRTLSARGLVQYGQGLFSSLTDGPPSVFWGLRTMVSIFRLYCSEIWDLCSGRIRVQANW